MEPQNLLEVLGRIESLLRHYQDYNREYLDSLRDQVNDMHRENQIRLRSLEDSRLQLRTTLWVIGLLWTAVMGILEFVFHNHRL